MKRRPASVITPEGHKAVEGLHCSLQITETRRSSLLDWTGLDWTGHEKNTRKRTHCS